MASLEGRDVADIDGLTPAQRFFLSWATVWRRNATDEYTRLLVQTDPHSPGPLRCSGPLANMAPFASAFGLPDDAPMLRPVEDRIEIW
jgi:putative endopeptidase